MGICTVLEKGGTVLVLSGPVLELGGTVLQLKNTAHGMEKVISEPHSVLEFCPRKGKPLLLRWEYALS